jgi:dihydrofolate reductase
VQRFLQAGLVDRITITRVPVLIGDGIPLFGVLPRDVRLRHVATQQYERPGQERVRGPPEWEVSAPAFRSSRSVRTRSR